MICCGQRTVFTSAVLSAVIGCALLGSTSTAEASCGDYLMDRHSLHQPMPHDGANSPATPCRGPHCGQRPTEHSVPVPYQRILVPSQDVAVLDAAVPAASASIAWDWMN